MKLCCMGCGAEKDTSVLEPSPTAEDDGLVSGPLPPLFVVGCQGPDGYKAVVVCHGCYHRLEVDMWISDRCWAAIKPAVPFDRLPAESDGQEMHDPETYAEWCRVTP